MKSKDKGWFAGKRTLVFTWSLLVIGLGLGGWAVVLLLHKPVPISLAKAKAPDFLRPSKLPSAPSKQQVESYTVAPTLPKYINIPAISIPNTEVHALGLSANGQIAVPSSSYMTGWYNGSSKPGAPGAMFIYGHVLGWYAGGIFYNLKELKPGDDIIVTSGDNRQFTYQVVTSKVYPHDKVNMQQVLAPIKPGVPGLNLMTCSGQLLRDSIDFTERLVVFTSLVRH
jgi:sortase (surface protein transpeptidase)